MSITVLRMGADTVDVSVGGAVRPYMAEALSVAKFRVQQSEKPELVTLGGLDLAIQAQGSKPYKFVLSGDELTIKLTDSTKIPGGFIHLSALGLALYDPDALYSLGHEIASECFGPSTPEKLSRLDVCIDFQGVDLSHLDGGTLVTPAKYRVIYPNTEHPESYQIGRDARVVRIYNKTVEMKAKPGKEWLASVWSQHPDYDPMLDVWRVEVQLRRDALRGLGIETPWDGFGLLPEVLSHGLDWADLRIVKGQSSDRWPRHPVWEELARVSASDFRLTRTALQSSLSELPQIVAAVAGYSVSAGARANRYDFDEVWETLGEKVRAHIGSPEEYAALARARRIERLGSRG